MASLMAHLSAKLVGEVVDPLRYIPACYQPAPPRKSAEQKRRESELAIVAFTAALGAVMKRAA